jgi:hypothetical protein
MFERRCLWDEEDENAETEFAVATIELIPIACKLRNPVLFRECFVHVVGRWKSAGSPWQKLAIEENVEDLETHRQCLRGYLSFHYGCQQASDSGLGRRRR